MTVTETDGSTAVTEGGATDTYSVVLTSEPTGDVTVSFAVGAGLEPIASVEFDPMDWDEPQEVTVVAIDDAVAQGSRAVSISHAATGGGYDSVVIGSVSVTITDNDEKGVTVIETDGSTAVMEGGATDTYSVVLTSEPTDSVTVSFAVGAGLEPIASVEFDPMDWDTPQEVTVVAVDDAVAQGSRAVSISHAATGGGYDGVSITDVSVTITDNDEKGVTVTETDGSTVVTEGGATDTYSVVLTSEPIGDVTVSFAVGSELEPVGDITFTTMDWDTPQEVTVVAIDDAVAQGSRAVSISHTAIGGGYDGVSIADVNVTITDNETTRTPPTPNSPKNGTAVYTYTPKLTWKSQKGATRYYVQLDDNDGFIAPLQESDPTAPKYTATDLPFGTYFWRVAVQDVDGWSEYSLPFSFDVTLNKSPKKNAATTDRTPKFTWLKVKDVLSYALRAHTTETDCNNNAGMPAPVIDEGDLSSPKFTQPTNLDLGSYYWHVSIDGGAHWTPCWRFDITTLKSPKYGSATTSLTPKFSWTKNKTATHYYLQVSTDETFVAPSVIDEDTLTGTTYLAQTGALDYGQYFWHVSEEVGSFGPFTPNGMFFITNMSRPANNTFTLKGKITFSWKKVADATGYTLTISKNPDGVTDPVFAPPTTTALKATTTLPRGIYYWRVETTGVVHIMPVWTFTIGP